MKSNYPGYQLRARRRVANLFSIKFLISNKIKLSRLFIACKKQCSESFFYQFYSKKKQIIDTVNCLRNAV